MSNAVLSHTGRPPAASALIAALVLAAWLGAILILGARGALATPAGTPPLPLLFALAIPLVAFFVAFRALRPFRDFVLGVDLRLVTAIQAWRAGGLGFLALYAHGVLPGVFALPAGLGDMAIGALAPWMAHYLARDPGFAASRAFRRWNLLGILDLVVAISIGTASFALASGAPGEITTAPMAQLPLVLIPAYLVPIFVMLHFSALYRAGRGS